MRPRIFQARTPIRELSWAAVPPDTIVSPGPELDSLKLTPGRAPGTVGSELGAGLELDRPPELEQSDYWYRATLPRSDGAGQSILVLEGLATIAEVWVNDERLARSENMFRRHELDVTDYVAGKEATLSVRFCALAPLLRARRPRPRWRTRIVDEQQLRWFRTSLLGRTPGFCPRVPVIGPYRPLYLERRRHFSSFELDWRPHVTERGSVELSLSLQLGGAGVVLPERAQLELEGAAISRTVPLAIDSGAARIEARLELDAVALWWPHSHGAQPLSEARIRLFYPSEELTLELGKVGFRRLERDPDAPGLGLLINGVPVFCRGACWSTDDLVSAGSTRNPRTTLELARRAGMNMLRVGGTTCYESDAFHDACDELGILLWQDFMFANMDYPEADASFCSQVRAEAEELLRRLQGRPSLAVLCGSSEVEQQAAMLGLAPELARSALFHDLLPGVARALVPEVPYVPSTPSGGVLPFHASAPVSHYYGVGAYLRPLSDVRASAVSFAAECLAFANVPDDATIEAFMRELETPPHHPRWKERVPRDRGVGWDFEDVRDHYLEQLFQVNARTLRYSDVPRYLHLSRATSAELIERVLSELRRPGSTCRGALIWLLKDFWPGAGWGLVDALGRPKAAYYAAARVSAARALLISDEGLNGYLLHVLNDAAHELRADVELVLYRDGSTEVARGRAPVTLPAHGALSINAETLLGRFHDVSYSYRFGAPAFDVACATLHVPAPGTGEREIIGRAFACPTGLSFAPRSDLELRAVLSAGEAPRLTLSAARFAQRVCIEVPGYYAEDNYFHLAPGEERTLHLHPLREQSAPERGWVSALNGTSSVTATKNRHH